MATTLKPDGQKLLRILIPYLDTVTIRGDVVLGCPTYTEVLQKLLPHWKPTHGDYVGRMIKSRGLDDLAEWATENGFPNITGLIVSKGPPSQPGEGYFNVIYKTQIPTWAENIQQAKIFDWSPYI
ncbi:MAG: hypothetical protein ABF751_11110 [Acetobacter orientalis]|uniref:hypothetical protein n=1 Tax=Acetobacter orientalis TaxID=146474 RepID=UPI0039E95FBC